jgi:hypothetical protein
MAEKAVLATAALYTMLHCVRCSWAAQLYLVTRELGMKS